MGPWGGAYLLAGQRAQRHIELTHEEGDSDPGRVVRLLRGAAVRVDVELPLFQQELGARAVGGASAGPAAAVAAAVARAAAYQRPAGRLQEKYVNHQRLVGLGRPVGQLLAHEIDFRDVDLELGSCAETRSAPSTARSDRPASPALEVFGARAAGGARAGPTHCASGDIRWSASSTFSRACRIISAHLSRVWASMPICWRPSGDVAEAMTAEGSAVGAGK